MATPKEPPRRQPSLLSRLNKRTIIIPALASFLFIYSVTSIRAAKANAQRYRDADTGGEGVSLLNESRRRHGMEGKVEGAGGTVTELVGEARRQIFGGGEKEGGEEGKRSASGRSENEEALRALRGARGRGREG